MSDDGFSIRRASGLGRISGSVETGAVEEPARLAPAKPSRSVPLGREVEPADTLPSELGGNVDLRLFERMNDVLVSPAMSSMTNRANVLHSVVSWLDAQSARLSGDGDGSGGASSRLPWLGAVIDTLNDEIALIEAYHRGTLRDVEGPVE